MRAMQTDATNKLDPPAMDKTNGNNAGQMPMLNIAATTPGDTVGTASVLPHLTLAPLAPSASMTNTNTQGDPCMHICPTCYIEH